VLDFGFGTGGPAIALVKNHYAEKVIGVDVEPQLRDRAAANIEASGFSSQIDLRIVKPGSLPFEDDTFDVVFSKDVMAHIEDKPALFREFRRILKPGGAFVASDWLSGSDDAGLSALAEFREVGHLKLAMATASETASMLSQSGFENVETRDRNAWYTPLANHEVEQIEGPLKQILIDAVGGEIYQQWTLVRKALARAATAGGLRPTHLKACNPDV